jgi:hypothetical protein
MFDQQRALCGVEWKRNFSWIGKNTEGSTDVGYYKMIY